MIWARKTAKIWASSEAGGWKDKPCEFFSTHACRIGPKGESQYYVPRVIVVLGHGVLNPDVEAFRALDTETGEWRGPFTSLAEAQGAFTFVEPETENES